MSKNLTDAETVAQVNRIEMKLSKEFKRILVTEEEVTTDIISMVIGAFSARAASYVPQSALLLEDIGLAARLALKETM